jgi:hypothetical protein
MCSGRWPEKSVRFLLRLLKNAESNADAKNLELEDLYVKSIVVQQAPVRPLPSPLSVSVPNVFFAENPPPHIPCARSHQPVPGAPRSPRGLPGCRRHSCRACKGQGRGCCAVAHRFQPPATRAQAHRGRSRVGGDLGFIAVVFVHVLYLCHVLLRYETCTRSPELQILCSKYRGDQVLLMRTALRSLVLRRPIPASLVVSIHARST